MKKVETRLTATVLFLFLISCTTNPPTNPGGGNFGTGKIFLNIKVDQTSSPAGNEKLVIIEDFANVSCIPCVQSNAIIESLTRHTYGPAKLVAVKFPTNFPSPSDPFYLARPEFCNAKMQYYNILFAPTTIIDGIKRPSSTDSIAIKAAIDERLALTPRFEITIVDSLFSENYFINISIRILNSSGLDLNETVLNTVVTETDIEFENPPGSNGETKFYDVMRDIRPSIDGETLFSITQAGEINYEFEAAINTIWILENLNTVAYIQNITSKEIYQAGSTFD